MELSEKLVLHVPEEKWCVDHLESIASGHVLDELIGTLENAGVISLYSQNAMGFYKGRCYHEILFTIFCENQARAKTVAEIFGDWFRTHNAVLKQEAFAYEWNGTLHIRTLERGGEQP